LTALQGGSFGRHPSGRIVIAGVGESGETATLISYLTEERYDVRRVGPGPAALRQVRAVRPDVVLLDITANGLEICRQLKQDSETSAIGVILLTGPGEEGKIVAALELGADDCVVKPFSPREMAARITAVLRRSKRAIEQVASLGRLRVGNLEIDRARFEVTMDGRPVDLTRKEFDLLATLAMAPGRVFERRQLLDLIWRPEGFVELDVRTVDVHMARLRRKFAGARLPPLPIDTVRGVGYRFRDPETS